VKKIVNLLLFFVILIAPMSAFATQQDKDLLISIAGKPVWVNKNSSISSELTYKNCFSHLYHLEKLTIQFVDLDNHIIVLEKENGEVLNWEPTKVKIAKHFLSTIPKDIDHELVMSIGNLFYWKDPQEMCPGWSDDVWNEIKKQHVDIGWNKTQCLLSWGKPEDVNTTTTAYSTLEQWVYEDNNYLYFENGILTSIQN